MCPRSRRDVFAVAIAIASTACGARSELGSSGPNGAGGAATQAASSSTGATGGGGATASVSIAASSSASSSSASSSSASSSSSSSSSASSSSSSSGTGGSPPTGCSDGTREGFVDALAYPGIAGCSGGWDRPGILAASGPTCGRNAGNSSSNPNGAGCAPADLCSENFHVCHGSSDVANHSSTGCDGAAPGPGLFFATRQGSTGCAICANGSNQDPSCNGCSCAMNCATNPATANDVFGCGSLGDPVSGCGPLDRFSNDLCGALGSPWKCGSDGCGEANAVTKSSPAHGGVLCCAD